MTSYGTTGISLESSALAYGLLNSELASLYDLPPPGTEFARVQFPAGFGSGGNPGPSHVPGAYQQAGRDLADRFAGSSCANTSCANEYPIRLPGTNSTLPPLAAGEASDESRAAAGARYQCACAGCHTLMDPVGLVRKV